MASETNSTEIHASAFQTRLPVSNCGILGKCEESKTNLVTQISNNSLRVPTATISSSNNNTNTNNNNNNSNGNMNSNSPKMGSRRIFTPQFKLQVLESYRSDSDCKGNQRATARKYNIHRRQIQKWLQCESNLRSSVANINQNSVKHQFHNISHHHQHQHDLQSAQRLSLSVASRNGASASNNGYSQHQHQHQHHHNHPQVPLDAAHQTLALNTLNVPSTASVNTTSAQGVLTANLAAAVAVAIASSSPPITSTTAASPLRPTAIGGTVGGSIGNSSVPSILHSHHHHHHHHHHQHRFPLSPYAHSPVAAPVPMLTHHIAPPPHNQPHTLHHHQHYPYHNLSPHTHGHVLPTLSHQPSAFMPTACLPVNVLSAVAAASPPSANATNTTAAPPSTAAAAAAAASVDAEEKEIEDICTDANMNVQSKLSEQTQNTTTSIFKSMIALSETITTTTTPSAAVLMDTRAHSYVYKSEFECVYNGAAVYADTDRMHDAKCKNTFQPLLYQQQQQQQQQQQNAEHDSLNTSMTSPMDLSLGSRRKSRDNFDANTTDDSKISLHEKVSTDAENAECHNNENSSAQVVDLTFRKRKVVATYNNFANETEKPQKLPKRLEDFSVNNNKIASGKMMKESHASDNDDNDNDDGDRDDDVEIEVEIDVESKHSSSKQVKLFKPYLLDESNDQSQNSKSNVNSSATSKLVMNEQREPIIWSNHPAFSYEGSCASNLHSPNADKHTFPNGSPYFLTSKLSSPQSVLSPTSALSLSPTSFPLRCPKGSPVSGYESSSSTCSERDDICSVTDNRPYSLDFQMHTVCDKKVIPLHKPLQIHEWLSQDTNTDTNTPPLARASIALYA